MYKVQPNTTRVAWISGLERCRFHCIWETLALQIAGRLEVFKLKSKDVGNIFVWRSRGKGMRLEIVANQGEQDWSIVSDVLRMHKQQIEVIVVLQVQV